MCFSRAAKRCTSRCLKFFSVILFLLSVGLIVASFTFFKPMKQKIESGKLHTEYDIEGNVVAKKLCKFGGVLGIFMSVLAYLTAAKKVPYFAAPFVTGCLILGGIFLAVFITTVDQETALFYKTQTCNAFAGGSKTAP